MHITEVLSFVLENNIFKFMFKNGVRYWNFVGVTEFPIHCSKFYKKKSFLNFVIRKRCAAGVCARVCRLRSSTGFWTTCAVEGQIIEKIQFL
jgi:hypothetical protein